MLLIVAAVVMFNRADEAGVTTAEIETPGMSESTELVTEAGVEYFPEAQGYFVRPAGGGDYPGVVMIHENRGLRSEIRTTAEELAREGYMVLAVDMYKGTVMETQDEARAYSSQFNQDEGTENLQAAAQYLREQGATSLASLGWCFGGAQSLALALTDSELDAAVIYYGRLSTTTEALAPLNAPVLGIFGDADQVVPTSSVAQFEAVLNARQIENEIYMYPGVGHAFANPSNPNHAPAETTDAWQKTLAFLEKHLR